MIETLCLYSNESVNQLGLVYICFDCLSLLHFLLYSIILSSVHIIFFLFAVVGRLYCCTALIQRIGYSD